MGRGTNGSVRMVVGALVAAGLLPLGGCVVAVGNDTTERWVTPDSGHAKFKLSGDEYDALPVIQSTSELPTISTRYSAQLARLGPGTTIEEFKSLFPQAQFIERRSMLDKGREIDAYAVKLEERFRYRGTSNGYVTRDEKWFYFEDNKLVKWGEPRMFP